LFTAKVGLQITRLSWAGQGWAGPLLGILGWRLCKPVGLFIYPVYIGSFVFLFCFHTSDDGNHTEYFSSSGQAMICFGKGRDVFLVESWLLAWHWRLVAHCGPIYLCQKIVQKLKVYFHLKPFIKVFFVSKPPNISSF